MNLTQILQREYKDMVKDGDRYDIDSKYMFYVERNYIDISYSDSANAIVSVYTKDTYATDDEIAKLVREFEKELK